MEENNVVVQLIKTIENLSFGHLIEYVKYNPYTSANIFLKEQLDRFTKSLLKMEIEK